MFDINLIREQPDLVREALRNRQSDPGVVDQVLALDVERRALLGQVETLKAERNAVSKEIGKMKDPAERQAKIEQMREVGDQIAALDNRVREVDEALLEQGLGHPEPAAARNTLSAKTSTRMSSCAPKASRASLTSRPCRTGTWAPPWASSTSSRA